MKISTRRRVGVLLAASGVVAAAVTVSSARAEDEDPVTVVADAGVLRLHTGADGTYVAYQGPLAVPSRQTFSVSSKCEVRPGSSLVTMTATGASLGVGLVSNGFGARNKNNCASGEGRIGVGETLTVALSSAFPADVQIVSAELDVEGKFNARLGVSTDGGAFQPFSLLSSSDNGPDSGVNDNDRVVVNGAYRSLTLKPFDAFGEVSLEAGGDGTYAQYLAGGELGALGTSLQTADTVFQLKSINDYDHAVDCGEPVEASVGDGVTNPGFDSALFTRGPNFDPTTGEVLDPTTQCPEEIGVTFTILDGLAWLDKSTEGVTTGTEQNPTGTVRLEWTRPAEYPLPAVEISYTGDAADAEPVFWCDGYQVDELGEPVLDAYGNLVYLHPEDPQVTQRFPNDELPWCLVADSAEVQSDGEVKRVQLYHGWGDPSWIAR